RHTLNGGAVALQLDIEPVAEQAHQSLKPCAGEGPLPGRDDGIERPAWATRERDQAFGLTRKRGELDVRRLVRGRIEERARIEPHQAAVAALARCKEDEARPHRGRAASARGLLITEIDRKRAADDRLDT